MPLKKPSALLKNKLFTKVKHIPKRYDSDLKKKMNSLPPRGPMSLNTSARNPFFNGKKVNMEGRKGTPMHPYRLAEGPTTNQWKIAGTNHNIVYEPSSPNWVNQKGRDGKFRRDRYGKSMIGERQKLNKYGKPNMVKGSHVSQCNGLVHDSCNNKNGCWFDTVSQQCGWDGITKL